MLVLGLVLLVVEGVVRCCRSSGSGRGDRVCASAEDGGINACISWVC